MAAIVTAMVFGGGETVSSTRFAVLPSHVEADRLSFFIPMWHKPLLSGNKISARCGYFLQIQPDL